MSSDKNHIGYNQGITPDNNVISYLYHHKQQFPERTALQWAPDINAIESGNIPHITINYGELTDQISCVAGGLRALGIIKGDRILIFLPMSAPMYIVMFAVQQIGASAVFLDSWARRDQLGVSAEIVAPKAMISFEQAFELVQEVPILNDLSIKVVAGPHTKQYSASLNDLIAGPPDTNIEPMSADDTALITFTTGSSGRPKGANRTHHFLASQHNALNGHLPYESEDIDLPYFPIFSLNNLAGGVTTILPAVDLARPDSQDPERIACQIQSMDITCTTLSPAIFNSTALHCIENNIHLTSLRRVVTGGAPVTTDMVKRFQQAAPQAEILVLYGSTEVEPIAHISADEMLSINSDQNGVCVGCLDPGLQYKFIRIQRESITFDKEEWSSLTVAADKPGELIVSGEHVCGAYYNDPEATLRAKIIDTSGTVWHRTGDVGLLDNQKRLWLMGRVHNTIIRNNEYVFPVHAESLLNKLTFTGQAAFLGIPDSDLGERTCAVVTLRADADQELRSDYDLEIRTILENADIITDEVRFVNDIPMDPRHHSKVEYSVLRKQLLKD